MHRKCTLMQRAMDNTLANNAQGSPTPKGGSYPLTRPLLYFESEGAAPAKASMQEEAHIQSKS